MIRFIGALAIIASATAATGPEDIAAQIKKLELDPEACYKVRDASFTRDDLKFYLTEGVLIFAKPVAGRRVAAVFSADVDGGDAELLVMPPSRGERLSMASFTGAPNLDEHFGAAMFVFTDDTGDALMNALKERGGLRPSMEHGLLLAPKWNSVVANIASSFGVRLVQHLLGGSAGFFYAGLQGTKLGSFDAYYDSTSPEQVFLGQIKHREATAFYDIWTSFPARPFRSGRPFEAKPDFRLDNFRIDASLGEDLLLKARVQAAATANRDGLRVLALEMSERMKIGAVKVDGAPAELFTSESLRANLARRNESQLFLVIPAHPLAAGRPVELEIEFEGTVVSDAGRGVYFVGARGNWYPRTSLDWARYDISFTYPAHLQMVFAGDLKEDVVDGDIRRTRRVTSAPIRMAGFNLGHYESVKQTRGGLTVEVYANKSVELGLRRAAPDLVLMTPPPLSPFPRRGPAQPPNIVPMPPAALPDPTRRLDPLATEIADAFHFFASHFGPPALDTLRVSPIPGRFGQGFPGLVYLSTMSYLSPTERPASSRTSDIDRLFSETLHAHEAAHQWWGNVVTSVSAQDDWLMEALASYSALMMVEKKKGPKAFQQALDDLREKLLARDGEGRTAESAGPVRLGGRLISSQTAQAWYTIVYHKGAWILHMLRKQLGDVAFLKMLGDLARQHRHQALSARQFQRFAAGYLPKGSPDPTLDTFFTQWVESTGIPAISMTHQVKKAPLRLVITVTQADVDDDFSVRVPVEIQTPRAKPQVVWVATGPGPAVVEVPLRLVPGKVVLDPESSILMTRR